MRPSRIIALASLTAVAASTSWPWMASQWARQRPLASWMHHAPAARRPLDACPQLPVDRQVIHGDLAMLPEPGFDHPVAAAVGGFVRLMSFHLLKMTRYTLFPRIARLKCNSVTNAVVIGLLALFQSVTVAPLLHFGNRRLVQHPSRLLHCSTLKVAIPAKGIVPMRPRTATAGSRCRRPAARQPDHFGGNAERLQHARKLSLRDRLAALPFRTRTGSRRRRGLGQLGRANTVQRVDALSAPSKATLIAARSCTPIEAASATFGQLDGRLARLVRPLAAGEVGNGQQQAPIVAEPIIEAGRHVRLGTIELLAIVLGPAQRTSPQFGETGIIDGAEVRRPVSPAFLRCISMMIERVSVVSGSLLPFMPITFGQNVGKACGVLSSPMQRRTQEPRVQPLLMTARSGSLLIRITSASSTMMVGCHFSMPRNSVASDDLDAHQSARHEEADKLSSCVLPLIGFGRCRQQDRRMHRRRIVHPGEHNPQRDGQRLVVAQHDVPLDAPDDGEQQFAGVDYLRPRLDHPVTE